MPEQAPGAGLDQAGGDGRGQEVGRAVGGGGRDGGDGRDLERRRGRSRQRLGVVRRGAGGAVLKGFEAGRRTEAVLEAFGHDRRQVRGVAPDRVPADRGAVDHRHRRKRPALKARGPQDAGPAGRPGDRRQRIVRHLVGIGQAGEGRG
jgi:hypothetical protein